MEYTFHTRLEGSIVLTSSFHTHTALQKDKTLYKFIWVRSGRLVLEVDHVEIILEKDDVIPLTPFHYLRIKQVEGEYLTILFNSNFYCIYGHDKEVSCNGFLFNGSSRILKLTLSPEQASGLDDLVGRLAAEYAIRDSMQEEMLRIMLKRFIITCTRIARGHLSITEEQEKSFELVRQFYVLVDMHYKTKKMVKEYADMLNRSPKTLSNLFMRYGLPSPLRVIHERIEAEAKRLLLYSTKSAKEIADILGFEDLATFSRFFKKMEGKSISEYRKNEKRE